jgi:hypothetical protein
VAAIQVANSDLTMSIPAGWVGKQGAEGMEFVSSDGAYELLISVATFRKIQGTEGRRAALEELMEIRRRAFEQLSGRAGQLLPTGTREEGDCIWATMVGANAAARALAYVRIVATPARLVTASLYRYGDLTDPKGFATSAEEICSALKVSSTLARVGWRRWVPW